MWNENQRGTSTFPMIIIFGVILAFLMAFLLIAIYNQQLDALVDEQAVVLANNLAQTAFASLSGTQAPLDLPSNISGSIYKVEVRDNSVFVVKIIGGRRAGNEYYASVNATVAVENENFFPGGRLYFMSKNGIIIVSASPISPFPQWVFEKWPTSTPPDFYYFAKENSKEAAAIMAAYFETMGDIVYYQWLNKNSMIVKIDDDIVRVNGIENKENVGFVDNSWIVMNVENFVGEIPENGWRSCPSVEEAWKNGWLYSPQQILAELRQRTWLQTTDNLRIAIPSHAEITAAAATTNMSTYITWRVKWQDNKIYVIHIRAMLWWEKENDPGFTFQSEPELHPIV